MSNPYKNMRELLKEAETEHFAIDHFSLRSSDLQAMISAIPAGDYVRLISKADGVRGEVIMSDTPMEKHTNLDFVHKAHGDILIAGLGIGMVPLAIQDKPEVSSITIVEKEEEIYDLITSQIRFNDKVDIEIADIYHYRPDRLFDCIYFDIWNYVNQDVYKDMLFLKDGFRRYLKPTDISPNRYIKCWAETPARYGHCLY